MRFTLDASSGVNVIRGYAHGAIRINDQQVAGTVILSATALLVQPDLTALDDLGPAHVERILALEPELVIVGSGARQVFPAPAWSAQFLARGIGFEAMDTGAACRTFNVVVGELRRAVAVLFV
jgi:uncharacterized protein